MTQCKFVTNMAGQCLGLNGRCLLTVLMTYSRTRLDFMCLCVLPADQLPTLKGRSCVHAVSIFSRCQILSKI